MSNQIARNTASQYSSSKANRYFCQTQSTANGSSETVIWDDTTSDYLSSELSYLNGDFTIQKSGVYMISLTIVFAPNATGFRQIYVEKDGESDRKGCMLILANTVGDTCLTTTWVGQLEKNDIIKAKVVQTSGGALDIESGTSSFNIASMK